MPAAPTPTAAGSPVALGPRDTLRDRIVDHLRRVGHDSISGIARALTRGGEAPAHRLTVAGYLQAMTDSGLLKEIARPPNKEYQMQNPDMHWTLHQRVWRHVVDLPRSEEDRVRLLIAILQTLLARPIFAAELVHAGAARIPEGIERITGFDEQRKAYRKLFERKGGPRIDVPLRDPLYALPAQDPLLASPFVAEAIRRLLTKLTGAESLVAEREAAQRSLAELVGGQP